MLRDCISGNQVPVQEFHVDVNQVTGKIHQDIPALQQPVHSEFYYFCRKQPRWYLDLQGYQLHRADLSKKGWNESFDGLQRITQTKRLIHETEFNGINEKCRTKKTCEFECTAQKLIWWHENHGTTNICSNHHQRKYEDLLQTKKKYGFLPYWQKK